MSILTFAFVYQKNKSIREDIDISFSNNDLKEKLKKFLLELKPLTKNDSIDETLKAKHYEFVFLKNKNNKLYIASEDLLKEMNYKSELKFGQIPYPKECTNSAELRICFNSYISKHIIKNFKYPNKALRKGIQGKVDCKFYIDREGNVVLFKLEGPDPLLESEAERILKKLPKFVPGTIKGVPVKMAFTIPITFKLD